MAAPVCRRCGGATWTESQDPDEHGRCADCREFPTLGFQVGALIEAVCAIPDGVRMGEPVALTDEQFRTLLHHYRVDPWSGRFSHFRGTQLTRPQKWGKGPFASMMICGEAHPEAPVLFDGWDADGQPVGRPWATPHIQVTAVSEDQTDNVFRALLPMIRLGALAADIPDTGLTRINLPSGGLIEPVTAAALSRLGQRVTFVVQDQTESWFRTNGGHKLADNQRRGLAGMGGRFLSTPNAWDPAEDSVAQRTAESKAPGVHHDDVDPGPGSVRNKQDRRRMLKKVYGDAASKPRPDAPWEPWIDLDRIDGEIQALLEHDPAQGERWFLNRKLAGESVAFDVELYKLLAEPANVPDKSVIAIGVDGARFRDALSIECTVVETGYQWTAGLWERPKQAEPSYEHPKHEIDGVMVELFRRFSPWRAYIDPQFIEHLVDLWQGRWGDDRVVPWHTNRDKPIAYAVRNYTTAIGAADFRHDGHRLATEHVRNARKKPVNVFDERGLQMHTISKDRPDSPRKMDAAMGKVLSWECRGDAIAAGALKPRRSRVLVAH
jgi:hypothetical protein